MFRTVASVAALVLAAAPALASAQEASVTVTAPTLAAWSTKLSKALDRELYYPPEYNGEGTVAVSFQCSDSGAPSSVAVLKSSGSKILDHAAMRAVRHVKSLHPLPAGLAHDQRYVALLLFAQTRESHDRQLKLLKAEAERRTKWYFDRGVPMASIGLLPPQN